MELEFMPPVEVVKDLYKRIHASTRAEKVMCVDVCAAVIRWALNPLGVMPTGVQWVYSIFHMQELTPHTFFRYRIAGDVLTPRFTVIEQDSSRFKTVVPSLATEDVRKSLQSIVNDGKFAIETKPFQLTSNIVNQALVSFQSYVYDDGVVFADKRVTSIYKSIPIVENTDHGCAIRVPGTTSSEYYDLKDLQVSPTYTVTCEECGESVPCCRSTVNPLCRSCSNKINYDDRVSCEHAECAAYGCCHYHGNIQIDNGYSLPLEFHDDRSYI